MMMMMMMTMVMMAIGPGVDGTLIRADDDARTDMMMATRRERQRWG